MKTAWIHPRISEQNLDLIHQHFAITEHLQNAQVAFINHETIQYLDKSLPLELVVSNTTEPIYAGPAEYIYLKDGNKLRNITATAEHTLGLIIASHRHYKSAHYHITSGRWNRYDMPIPDKMLSEMTLGIVGNGRIAGMLEDMTFPLFKQVWKSEETTVIERNIPNTEVLCFCCNPTVEVCFIQWLAKLPRGAIIVNTSRGNTIDNLALIRALECGYLSAAAIDVLSDDNYWNGSLNTDNSIVNYVMAYYRAYDNLIITPHIGGSVRSAWENTQRLVIEEAIEWLK